ncbi:MAG: GGDEF domain-containing protein [Deltaproteobacteria bacterium]|nr:GGDEF domain-containing protein [Deltaproteobacteria bacterium]
MNSVPLYLWGEAAAIPRSQLPRRAGQPEPVRLAPGCEGLVLARETGGVVVTPRLGPEEEAHLLATAPLAPLVILELDPDELEVREVISRSCLHHFVVAAAKPELLAGLWPLAAGLARYSRATPARLESESGGGDPLGGLLKAAAEFRMAENREDLYQLLTSAFCRHLPFGRAILFVWEDGRLLFKALSWPGGDEEELRQTLLRHPAQLTRDSPEYESFSLGLALPLRVERTEFFATRVRELLAGGGEMVLTPLFSERDFQGVLAVDLADKADQRWTQAELTLLETSATLAGTLLFNLWLYSELEERNEALELKVRELSLVSQLTALLNRTGGPEAMANDMLALTAQSLEADFAFLFTYEESDHELRLLSQINLDEDHRQEWSVLGGITPGFLRQLTPPPGRGPAGQQAFCEEPLPNLPGPALIRVLESQGNALGLWGLGRGAPGREFGTADHQVLGLCDEQLALALHSLQLRHQATTDDLTGLYTRRHFTASLEQELRVARYLGHPLTLIILDLDHFKKVNDNYGHLAGDQVLLALGRVLRESTRSSDVCARLGGEEFAVILPRCSLDQALVLAERIRTSLENRAVDFNGQSIAVTASLGLAAYDPSANLDAGELTHRADQAMYAAKRAGRNRVKLWQPPATGAA